MNDKNDKNVKEKQETEETETVHPSTELHPDRKKVNSFKSGEEEAERFDKFKTKISKCIEFDLFIIIDQIGYIIWRMTHDLADGRIEYPEWDKNDKLIMQAEIELAVEQTNRFDVVPFFKDTVHPSTEYMAWYGWWKGYIEKMSKDKWDEISKMIANGEDYSHLRPEGSWK